MMNDIEVRRLKSRYYPMAFGTGLGVWFSSYEYAWEYARNKCIEYMNS